MKKQLFIYLALCMGILCSCGDKKVYRPSQFPNVKQDYSFAIPYQEKNNQIIVRIRLNGSTQFEGTWDSGCSVPLKISSLEADQLKKNGTLSSNDYRDNMEVIVANGQKAIYSVYLIKNISFTDKEGVEHKLVNVPAVIDDNVNTDILIGLPVMQELGYSYEIDQYDQYIYYKE